MADEDVRALLSNPEEDHMAIAANNTVESEASVADAAATTETTSLTALIRGTTWRQRITVITAMFVDFVAMSCMSIMAPFLPLEADRKGIDGTTTGIIFACFELVMFFGSLVIGRYLTTIGARFCYISGILVAASCSILFGFLEWCPPGEVFAVTAISCRVVEALGCSMAQTASTAIVANEFPTHIATVFGLIEAIAGLGLMAGPLIGGTLYDLGGFFLPFVTIGGAFFITGITASFTLPTTAVPAPKDRAAMFRVFIKLPAVIICGICMFSCAACYTFFDPTLANQLAAIDPVFAHSQTLIGLVFIVLPALYTLLSPFAGYLADNYKHQLPLLVLGNAGFITSFILVGPCPLLPIPSKQLWLTIVSFVIMGIACSFSFMPTLAVINKACKKAGLVSDIDLYGFISGFFGFALNLGSFTGPLIGGFLVQQLNSFEWATSVMVLPPSINILAICFLALILRETGHETTSAI